MMFVSCIFVHFRINVAGNALNISRKPHVLHEKVLVYF